MLRVYQIEPELDGTSNARPREGTQEEDSMSGRLIISISIPLIYHERSHKNQNYRNNSDDQGGGRIGHKPGWDRTDYIDLRSFDNRHVYWR